MKKLVPATRSISCITTAASSGGKASRSRNAVTNCAQTKNGSRIQVIPLARSWMIVAMKLTAPRSDEVIRRMNPTSQSVWPFQNGSIGRALVRDDRQRRVGGPAAFGRAARNEKADQHDDATDKERLVARHVDLRESHVRRADLERHDEIAESGEGDRHDAEEDHDRAVHRA